MMTIGGRAHTLDEIRQVCELGYPFAEINLSDPGKVESQMATLKDLKEKYGIYYIAHYPNEGNPSDVNTLQRVFVPKIKKLLELSSELKIKKGTIHFWMDHRWAPEDLIVEKMKMLSELTDHAAKFKVTLCLENLTARQDTFSRCFSEIPDLRMTMDIGHGQLLTRENTAFGFMTHVFEKIVHVHAHDNLGGTGVEHDLHLPLGEGIVDYPQIFSILREKGYDSTITMEVKPGDMAKTRECIEQFI